MANPGGQSQAIVPSVPGAPMMMQPGMMQPGMQPPMMQQMLLQQQMMMNPMMMQQPMPPGAKPPDGEGEAMPGAPKEVRKKHVEYQRLIKKGNNAETVFIGGLRKTTDEDQVAAHFAKYGQVEKVEIKRQPDGTSRGFAFVKFKDGGAVDKVINARAQHMIDNKWIDVKRHNGVAACAGRAASLTKPEEPKEEEPADQEDLEDKWTQQYLTMAQQFGQMQDTPAEDDEDQPPQPPQQPMVAMQPMMMPMPMMAMPMAPPGGAPGAPPKDGGGSGSQEPIVTGFMTVDPNVLGIRGGPPNMIVGVPMLSNGQPAVPIPGFNPGMMNGGSGGCGAGGCNGPASAPVGAGPVGGGPVGGAPLALPPPAAPPAPPAPLAPPGPGSFQAIPPGGPGMMRPGPYGT